MSRRRPLVGSDGQPGPSDARRANYGRCAPRPAAAGRGGSSRYRQGAAVVVLDNGNESGVLSSRTRPRCGLGQAALPVTTRPRNCDCSQCNCSGMTTDGYTAAVISRRAAEDEFFQFVCRGRTNWNFVLRRRTVPPLAVSRRRPRFS